ncbi:HXXXD-type acyl-transferase family protein [Perilla frutescens var. hirtella]|uniref:HXXXD-type acyl-transferase family protein n=1 Tax=Perilla frutescens var. hirtella TaxID=608512 RepID=A0AAD4IQT8_PERFH|nr:HXXXD-type acyl-transferase family protein [Perilla frutescens var. hirtella]
MESSLHVNQAVLITPSEPTPNQILQLSALDSQLFVRFTFEYLLVYKPRRGIDRDTITDNVKSALGRALVPYYPLAGRVRTRPDGKVLEVVCRSQGALFIAATVSSFTVSEFDGAPQRRAHWRNLLSFHAADVLNGAPPLVVQLTWLQDGGATLAVGFNHCLCDGVGSGEFLNSFAELALGLTELRPRTRPTWSRHLLNPILPLRLSLDDSISLPVFGSVPDVCGFTSRFVRERLMPTSIIFDQNRLNELKESTKSKPSHRTRTSFEVVSGHVWRSWARALNLASNQVVKLVFPVNIRQRVSWPSLPSGYYGNAVVLGCAEACVADLEGKGLSYAAELVARAKERVGEEYVREVVESVSWEKRARVDPVGALIMTQWSRLGLESVDFGMGRPVQVGPVCWDKYFIVLPVCGVPNALKVSLAVPPTALDQYLYFLTNIHV